MKEYPEVGMKVLLVDKQCFCGNRFSAKHNGIIETVYNDDSFVVRVGSLAASCCRGCVDLLEDKKDGNMKFVCLKDIVCVGGQVEFTKGKIYNQVGTNSFEFVSNSGKVVNLPPYGYMQVYTEYERGSFYGLKIDQFKECFLKVAKLKKKPQEKKEVLECVCIKELSPFKVGGVYVLQPHFLGDVGVEHNFKDMKIQQGACWYMYDKSVFDAHFLKIGKESKPKPYKNPFSFDPIATGEYINREIAKAKTKEYDKKSKEFERCLKKEGKRCVNCESDNITINLGSFEFEIAVDASYYEKMYPEIKKVIFNKPATVVILKNGTKGIAKLCPGDEWSEDTGFWCAYARALRALSEFN